VRKDGSETEYCQGYHEILRIVAVEIDQRIERKRSRKTTRKKTSKRVKRKEKNWIIKKEKVELMITYFL